MDHNLDLLKQTSHRKMQTFVESTLDHALLPVITEPTRISKTSATLIDNVMISDKLQSNYTSNILVSNLSDHLPCYVEIIIIIIIIVYFRYVYNITFLLYYISFIYSCIGKRLIPEPCGYIQVELGGLIDNDTSGMRCSRQ